MALKRVRAPLEMGRRSAQRQQRFFNLVSHESHVARLNSGALLCWIYSRYIQPTSLCCTCQKPRAAEPKCPRARHRKRGGRASSASAAGMNRRPAPDNSYGQVRHTSFPRTSYAHPGMRSGVSRTVLRSHASLRHMAPTYSAVAPRAAIVPPRRACILHWHASPRGCTHAAHRPRRVQGPFPPQYSVLPSVIVQAARSIVAAIAPAIQAAEGVTVPAPTTTISAPFCRPVFCHRG